MYEDFIGTGELALLLGVSAATLAKMVRRGELPPATHCRGSRRFWAIDNIRDAIDRLRQPRPLANRIASLPATVETR
jgi:predicted DNA-binding transcriptional regulator AlpA